MPRPTLCCDREDSDKTEDRASRAAQQKHGLAEERALALTDREQSTACEDHEDDRQTARQIEEDQSLPRPGSDFSHRPLILAHRRP
jgi:hypothetical protein